MVQQGKKEIEGIRKYIEVDLDIYDKYRSRPSGMDLHQAGDIWDLYGENLKRQGERFNKEMEEKFKKK